MISKYRSQALIGDGCHLVTSDSQIFGLNKHLQSFNHTTSNQQLCDHNVTPIVDNKDTTIQAYLDKPFVQKCVKDVHL